MQLFLASFIQTLRLHIQRLVITDIDLIAFEINLPCV